MGVSAGRSNHRGAAFLYCCLAALFFAWFVTPVMQSARAQDDGESEKKAAEPAAESSGKTGSGMEKIVTFFIYGLLFITSIALVALIVLLFLELRLNMAIPPDFVEEFTETVNNRKFKEAFEMSREETSFVGRTLTAGMGRLQYGIEDAREAAAAMVDVIKARKEQIITYLATIGTLGPLLGLVGTVFGMIISFKELGREGVTPRPAELARGISTALNLTLFGVGLAVPAIFFHAFFRNRLVRLTMDTSNVADDLLTQMYHNSKRPAPAATATTTTAAVDARTTTAKPG